MIFGSLWRYVIQCEFFSSEFVTDKKKSKIMWFIHHKSMFINITKNKNTFVTLEI